MVVVLVFLPLLVELLGVLLPAILGVGISLSRWNGLGSPEFVGFANYALMVEDPVFSVALGNTAIWLLLFGTFSYVLGLAVALLLQADRRGVGVYRTIIFLPVVFSSVVTALIWTSFFQPDGLVNWLLEALGLGEYARAWLGDPDTVLYAVVVAALWRQVGYVMVLFLAGLKSIDPHLIEAARVDGANAWQRLRFVVLPQLRNVNMVVISVIIIDALRSFDIVWGMTRGGPFNSSELLSTYMFVAAFGQRALGYGSAIGVVILVLALGFIITYLSRALREEKES